MANLIKKPENNINVDSGQPKQPKIAPHSPDDIREQGMKTSVSHALKRGGINTTNDLKNASNDSLMKIRGVGPKSFKEIDPVREKIISQGFGPTVEQKNASFDALNKKFNEKYGGASGKIGTFRSPERLTNSKGEINGWRFKTKYPFDPLYHTIEQSDDGTYKHTFYKYKEPGQKISKYRQHPKWGGWERQVEKDLSDEDVSNLASDWYKDWEYEINPETGEKYVHKDTADNMDLVFNYPKEHYIEGPDAHKSFDDMVNAMVGEYGRRYKDGNQYDWTNFYRDAVRRAMKEKGIDVDKDKYYEDDGWDY